MRDDAAGLNLARVAARAPGTGTFDPPFADDDGVLGSQRPGAGRLALFIAAYVLAAAFAQWLAIIPGTGISIWPPCGLYLATLVATRRTSWPWWVGAAVAAELIANALWFHNTVPIALLLHAGNALCALVGAWLVLHFGERPARLETLRDVAVLVVFGGLVAPLSAATVGAATLFWWEGQSFTNAWALWWIGDATGVLLLAPVTLVALQSWRDKSRIPGARLFEAALIGASLLTLAALSLDGRLPFAYIVMPPLLWASVRFQFRGAVVTLVALALVAAIFTAAGLGPFAGDAASQEQKHVMLQLFLAVSALSALVVAALARQHEVALRRLTAVNEQLEQRVAARTRELSQSEQRFRALAHSVPIIVWVTDANGAIEFVNQEYEHFFGLREAQARSVDWRTLLHPDDAPAYGAAFEAALQSRREFQATARVRRADGTWRYVASRGVPRTAADGTFLGMVGVSPDVTSRKEHEDGLAEAARQKDAFLAMLAHELRNPLAPVRNVAELLRGPGRRDPAVESARAIIERQVTHMARLVDDLMDVSRVSRGRIVLERAPVDLAAVVRQAVETHRWFIDARRHRLLLALPDTPLRVNGDFTRLSQAVGNLIDNAVKYTEPGGRIEIVLERAPAGAGCAPVAATSTPGGDAALPRAQVRVRDSGRGIDASAMHALFDMFYQAESTLDRAEGGLGIGLALVKHLAEMHGGSVHASSTGRGQGSEFTLTLPLLLDSASPAGAPAPAPAPAVARRRVLVVDDNHDAADSLAMLLRLDGHEVQTAYDGARAVQLAIRNPPSVVLLDLGLPGLDGYAACRAMRHGGLDRTLIVALTGYGQAHDQRASAAAGFDAHCVKPADPEQIRALLARAA